MPYWLERKFRVGRERGAQLRRLLAEEKFVELGAEYRDEDIADGEMSTFRLRANGREKSVYCENWYPEPLSSIRSVMTRLAASAPPGTKTTELTLPEARERGAIAWDLSKPDAGARSGTARPAP
ncbi:MAG TPA: hypothetical protein VMF89_04225 [Polyangiales bacterium]|nr:hypothetical protein [Polyangiales bacterium]